MAKLTLNNITSGFATHTLQNSNNDLIEAALENTLSRDGTTPNTMGVDLDMDSHDINNVGAINAASLVINGASIIPTPTSVLASQMGFTPYGNISSTTVQNAIQEEVDDLGAIGGASLIGNTPAGTISATTVQTALNELDTEKVASTSLSASSGTSLVGFIQAGTGAVARTAQSKLRETVSVSDFGAVGDGTTDDTVAIQAAITYVKSLNGGTVHFPSKIFNISSPLLIDSSQVSLEGESSSWYNGSGSTIRQTTLNTTIIKVQGASSAARILANTIDNLLLVHGSASATDDTNTGGTGIELRYCNNIQISRCTIVGMNKGISLYSTDITNITKTKIFRVWATPVGVTYGIHISDDGTNACGGMFFDTVLIGGPSGVQAGTFTGVYYAGALLNDLYLNTVEVFLVSECIHIELTAPTVDYNVKILNCMLDSYQLYGIYLHGFTASGGVDIIGNWIAPTSGMAGIVRAIFVDNCTGINILGNEIVGISNVTNANGVGVYFSTCSGCSIVSNRFRDFAVHFAADNLLSSTVCSNTFVSPSGTAALYHAFLNTACTDNVVVGNSFNASAAAGVGLAFGAASTGNSVSSNSYSGTFTTAKVVDASAGNTNGIRVEGTTSGAGAGAGTLANAPAAGNPTYWIPIVVAGTTKYIPAW